MKRSLILFSIIGLIIFTEKTYCMPCPPEMDICYVKFNYQSGHAYDALTLKKNSYINIVAPEWANGQSTTTGVAQKVTEGVYNLGDTDGDIDYDTPNGIPQYSSGSMQRTFNLTGFLYDIKRLNNVKVNCSDTGNLFNIFSSSLGLASKTKRIYGSFTTKNIDPIGSPNWFAYNWGYHLFGWFNNKVNDSCIRVNQGNPILPSNMSQSTYDNYLLASGSAYSGSNIGVGSVY